MMRASRLIAETDRLAHNARVATVVARARTLAPAAADALVAELAGGDRYSRELGLLVADAASRVEGLGRYLGDSDVELRAIAASRIVRFAEFDAAAAVEYSQPASAVERGALVSAILRWRRTDLADALVPVERAAHRHAAAARLLSAASAAVVEPVIDEVLPSLRSVAAVAHAHPLIFMEHARRDLSGLPPRSWASWWQRRGNAVIAAVQGGGSMERAMQLVEQFPPQMGWVRWHSALLGMLARNYPERVVSALLASPHSRPHLSRAVLRGWVEHPTDHVLTLAARLLTDDPTELRRLVLAGAPAARSSFLRALVERLGTVPRFEPALVAALPHNLRIQQARESIRLATGVGRPPYSEQARLPFAEAEPLLRPLLAESEPGYRAQGYRLLVESVGYSNDAAQLETLLASFDRLRNEQEPVRSAAIEALGALPLRLFDDGQLQSLARIVDDAFAAREHSDLTAGSLRRLAGRFLGSVSSTPAMLEFAVAVLARSNGRFFLPDLGGLSRPLAQRVVEVLLPLIDEHSRADRYDVLFALAGALGDRAHGIAALDDRLARATVQKDHYLAGEAIRWWLSAPRTRVARVRDLMRKDPSVVMLDAVRTVVGGAATDLLTPRVMQGAFRGRFRSPQETWFPPAQYSTRWTGRQREEAAAQLAATASRVGSDEWLQLRAVSLAAAVAQYGLGVVLAAAASDSILRQERALGLLGRMGPGHDVDRALTAALSTDRARVAGPALVRRAGLSRDWEVEAMVHTALAAEPKLTVRKSLVFAIARADLADPWPLIAQVEGEIRHPDLQRAVASSQLRRVDDPRVVGAMLAALSTGLPVVGSLDPCAIAPTVRHEIALRLAGLADSPVPLTRLRAALVAPRWIAFASELRSAMWALLADVRDRPTHLPDAGDLVRSMLDSGHPQGFATAIAALLVADGATDPLADSTARERIESMLAPFAWFERRVDHDSTAGHLGAIVDLLVRAGAFAVPAASVALRLFVQSPDAEAAERLARALDGRPAIAVELVHVAPGFERLTDVVQQLADSDAPQGILAVAALESLTAVGRLGDEQRSVLASLRGSPFPDVRERARRVVAD